ncbi:SIS domain-containing protein [Nocardioides sp.]|uniref:SIS domain-containing protein n=1 Tax=Nocardioides sp. TaxID=35761 RepID=UPI002E2F0785|nr:SIS domain-containing protein [Nocardioides sp.]
MTRTWMRTEIAEQSQAVAATVEEVRRRAEQVRTAMTGRRRILLVARGSSDNAAVYGRYLVETRLGIPAALAAPSVATHYHARLDLSDTLVVSVSQSGRTEEIVAVQRWAAELGAATIGISNDASSPLATESDVPLTTQAGVERAVPATKSYSAQLAALAGLAAALDGGEVLWELLARVPAELSRLESAEEGVAGAVDLLAESDDVLVTGRGLGFGTALEVGLKLEETCLRPVRGLSYADLRHGPIAVVGPGLTAVVVAAPDGPMLAPIVELAGDLAGRGARVLGVGGDAALAAASSYHVPGPELPEPVAPIGLIVPAQLVVESLARRLGLDPDAPRGLSKVTATDPR